LDVGGHPVVCNYRLYALSILTITGFL
jgi:hypothetical protein